MSGGPERAAPPATTAGGALPAAPDPPPARGRAALALGPLLFALCLAAPPPGLDAIQARTAAVTLWTAAWWITGALPLGITALLPAVLFPVLGVLSARAVAPFYAQDLVLLFLGAFLVSRGVERWGVHRRIALAIVARVGPSPRRLVLGFMAASAFLSLWINNTSTTLLMLPIGSAVLAGAGAAGRGPFATALLLGVAYSASVGGIGTPVGTAPNQIFLGHLRAMFPAGPSISFGEWVVCWLPLVVLYVPAGWWILTRLALRVPAEGSGGPDAALAERRALGPWRAPERRMAGVFALTALLWITRADLRLGGATIPGWARLVLPGGAEGVSDATVALAMALACFLVPSGAPRGGALLDFESARGLPWDILLLFGGGFALAGAFAASGLDAALGSWLGGLFAGLPPWAVVLGVVAFMAALTEVTSNVATTTVLVPILGRAAVGCGLSPLYTMMPAAIAASAAFMLPVGTPPNAVVYSSGLVSPRAMARVGLWVNALLVALVTLTFTLWGTRVLGLTPELPAWAGAPAQGSAGDAR